MKNKTLKPKVKKIKNKPELYGLKEVLDLIGKKLHGNDWIFESHSFKTDPDYMKYQGTLHVTHDLIKNNFFDVIKSDGKKLEDNEDVVFFIPYPTLNYYKIPKEQLDYVLKTRNRFRDRIKSKFPRALIYTACFGRQHGNIVVAEFNEAEINKIRDCLTIEDFSIWLKENDLKEMEIFPILLGMNPKYYYSLSQVEKQMIASKKIFPLGQDFQYSSINDFVQDTKTLVIWHKSWDQLIKDLYEKSLILNPTFSKRCARFLAYIKEKKLLPNHFDKYLDFSQYRPDYTKYFTNQKSLTKEDAAFLVMGLEPSYAKKYWEYLHIVGNAGGYYSFLKDDEKIFFYKSYSNFIDENLIFISAHSLIQGHSNYKGDLEEFINDLFNQGFVFDEFLLNSLTKLKKKHPTYQDSRLSQILRFFSKMQYWTFDDIFKLMTGKNPLGDEKLFHFVGKGNFNEYTITQFKEGDLYSISLKSNRFCKIDRIDQFYQKFGQGYAPRDVLEWLIKYTNVNIASPLLELVFEDNPKKLSELRKVSQNSNSKKSKTGRPTKINYLRIWVIFITEILEGNFDESNSNSASQAKNAFDSLSKEKQTELRKTAKNNFAYNILSYCEKEMEVSLNSIAYNIVEPFIAEFSAEFFQ